MLFAFVLKKMKTKKYDTLPKHGAIDIHTPRMMEQYMDIIKRTN